MILRTERKVLAVSDKHNSLFAEVKDNAVLSHLWRMVSVGFENVRVHYSALVSPQSLVKCDWVYFVHLTKA